MKTVIEQISPVAQILIDFGSFRVYGDLMKYFSLLPPFSPLDHKIYADGKVLMTELFMTNNSSL